MFRVLFNTFATFRATWASKRARKGLAHIAHALSPVGTPLPFPNLNLPRNSIAKRSPSTSLPELAIPGLATEMSRLQLYAGLGTGPRFHSLLRSCQSCCVCVCMAHGSLPALRGPQQAARCPAALTHFDLAIAMLTSPQVGVHMQHVSACMCVCVSCVRVWCFCSCACVCACVCVSVCLVCACLWCVSVCVCAVCCACCAVPAVCGMCVCVCLCIVFALRVLCECVCVFACVVCVCVLCVVCVSWLR